jgi:hypothetical protein
MDESILQSVKKTLNLPADYAAFDQDVIMHINSVFSTLNQLGVGPYDGFMIEDEGKSWSQFIGNDPRLNHVKTYVYLRVRLLFDPPNTGFHVAAMKEQIQELEWRLNAQREDTQWVDPTPPVVPLDE